MKTFVLMYVLAAIPGGAADSRPMANVTGGQRRGTTLDKAGAPLKASPMRSLRNSARSKIYAWWQNAGTTETPETPGVNALRVSLLSALAVGVSF
jgi:hypothetical protein